VRASEIMTSPVITVTPRTPARDAAALLERHGFTALPAVDDDGALVGIVTDADLLRRRIHRSPRTRFWHREPERRAPPGQTVGDVMTRPAVGMSPQTDSTQLAEVMVRDHVRSIPIVRGCQVVGIVTRRDLLRTIIRSDTDIAEEVRHHLDTYSGPQRWTVSVTNGVVDLIDEFDDQTDHDVVTVLVQGVPGVAHATIRSRHTAER
jgi:CBS domain-containing protein